MCIWCLIEMGERIERATRDQPIPDGEAVVAIKYAMGEGWMSKREEGDLSWEQVSSVLDQLTPECYRDLACVPRIMELDRTEGLVYLLHRRKWTSDFNDACLFRECQRRAVRGLDSLTDTLRAVFHAEVREGMTPHFTADEQRIH